MKKQAKTQRPVSTDTPYFKRQLMTVLLYSLIFPLILKIFVDIPAGVADYICNSYAGVYPTATTVGIIATQVLTVITEMLRAGFIGCVLCALLYVIGKQHTRSQMAAYLSTALLSPLVVSSVGMGLNYFCVLVGFSRDTVYFFEAKLPQLIMAALMEYLLYAVLLVISVLILFWFSAKKPGMLFSDGNGFFPTAILYRAVTVAIALFGAFSLVMTVSDMIVDLKIYADITTTLSGVMGYLVLPYLYLIFKLVSMLFMSAMLFRRMNRKFGDGREAGI